jgi:DNA-directed RNA polymerase specialized sigma24 family protein
LHRHELAAKVRHALADLSEYDREIIMLRNYEGLSNGEAACLLDVGHEAAKKRYTRALLRLRRILCNHGITGGGK